MITQKPKILIVDDEESARINIQKALIDEKVVISEAHDTNTLKSLLEINDYDIIILDLDIPDEKGKTEFYAGFICLDFIVESHPNIPVIVFSDYDENREIKSAIRKGAFDFIGKNQPGAQKELVKSVNKAWIERQQRLSNLSESRYNVIKNLKINMQNREFNRIEKRISEECKLLEISEELYLKIKERRLISTDPKEVYRLEKEEQQERKNIEEIEGNIAELYLKLEEVREIPFEQISLDTDNEIKELPILVSTSLQFEVLPVGVYDLLKDIYEVPFVTYEINNSGKDDLSLVVSSEIERFSDQETKTVNIKAGEKIKIEHSPVLDNRAIENVTRVTSATFHSKITLLSTPNEQRLIDNAYRIKIHSKDTVPLLIKNLVSGESMDLTSFIAAWVIPHTSGIEEILHKATNYHPDKAIFGYQGGARSISEKSKFVREQVEAMFLALKKETNIRYLNSIISYGHNKGEVMQRVRFPENSLKLSVANCIDGAVLFSSMLESASMNPIIVLVPGHAFAGWEIWDGENEFEFLETTMIPYASFSDAMKSGKDQFKKWSNRGQIQVVSIKESRDKGILPIPYATQLNSS